MESWLRESRFVRKLKTKRNIFICFAYEFCGTCLITYAYNLTYPATGKQIANPFLRGLAYFMGWIMACSVSGAHFNPATSLAVYIFERKKSNTKILLGYIISQFLGAMAGILMSYLMVRYWGAELYPNLKVSSDNDFLYMYYPSGTLKYGRLVAQELLQTFTFTLVFLVVKYRRTFCHTDDIVKGLVLAGTLYACYHLDLEAGESFNPAFALAESSLMFARQNILLHKEATPDALWVYMIIPFIGASLSAAMFIYMDSVEKRVHAVIDKEEFLENIKS
eukprot:403376010